MGNSRNKFGANRLKIVLWADYCGPAKMTVHIRPGELRFLFSPFLAFDPDA
jgi:hypothetical protein